MLKSINAILRKKDEFLKELESNSNPKDKKRGRPLEFDEINQTVWKWFCMARESNIPISGPMIQFEAGEIANRMSIDKFKASNGWLGKWKSRYNVSHFRISGEDGDVDEEVIGSWVKA